MGSFSLGEDGVEMYQRGFRDYAMRWRLGLFTQYVPNIIVELLIKISRFREVEEKFLVFISYIIWGNSDQSSTVCNLTTFGAHFWYV